MANARERLNNIPRFQVGGAVSNNSWEKYIDDDMPKESFSDLAQTQEYLPLNVRKLVDAGVIRITQPGDGRGGYEVTPEPWSYSLVTAYNDQFPNSVTKNWPSKPESIEDATTSLNTPGALYDGKYRQILWSAKQAGLSPEDVFLNKPKKYQEGGEVTDEFPEEAGVMPDQNPSEAAKRLLYYKKTAAPRLPPGVVPDTGQLDGMYQEPTVASETARVFGMQPRQDRYNILPRYVPGEGIVAPEMLYDAARAVASPNVARQGYEVAPEDAVNMAFNVAGGGFSVSSAMKKPTGEGGKVVASSVLPSSTTARDDLAKMPKPSKVLAPANEIGFYSPTEAAALNLQRKSGPGQAFLNDIMKGENVRSGEISAMGLDTFLKDKKNITADEVRDYIAQNKIQLGETQYGRPKEDPVGLAKRKEVFDKYEPQIKSLNAEINTMPLFMKAGDRYIVNYRRTRIMDALNDLQLNRDAEADAAYKIPETKDTKFSEYALPGGANYREIVLTLPDQPVNALSAYAKYRDELYSKYGKSYYQVEASPEELNKLNSLSEATSVVQPQYRSSHWDEPNPLAHLRVSDHVTDGKKTLLVDEVQSDWHQAGREQGYVDPNKKPFTVEADQYGVYTIKDANGQTFLPYVDGDQMSGFMTKEAAENAMRNNMTRLPKSQGVPDAPYKDDWYQLTLRRAIKEAIDGGYDRVAITPAKKQIDRYTDALRANVDHIEYEPYVNDAGEKRYEISGIKNGDTVVSKENLTEKRLVELVGKDIAKKITSGSGESLSKERPLRPDWMRLSGDDLTIGGEGMKKYYDEIYPTYLQKFGKKYGAASGKTTVDVRGKPEPLFYMEITPKMREEFTSGIPMKEGGEVTDEFPEEAGAMPDQNPSEAAKRLLYYKKTAAPTPPTDIARLGKQAGLIGLGFAPGAGVADYFGKFPAVEGGTEPSAVENFQKGNYGTAALQGLGAMGDLAMAVPVAGAAIGSVMKAPRAAQRILSSSTTAKDDLTKLLGYSEDIPNEKWLAGKVEDAVEGGTNSFGVPRRMGSTTGYFGKPVEVPVDLLAKLPGERGEQSNVRKDSLDYIRKNWDKVSKEPPYIEVDPFGKAWVSEGNHRIMVAKELGVKTLPVVIRYFSGGQRKAGELAPEKILEYNLPSTTTAKEDLAKVPKALKSATGNKGTYDTESPVLNKAKGGEVRKPK